MTTHTYLLNTPRRAARALALEHVDVREVVLRGSLVVIAAALLLYGYFIAATVSDVLTRTHAEKMTATLNTEMSNLESAYLAKSAGMTRTFAEAQGYKEAQGTLFAVSGGAGKAVAFAPHEVR